MKIKLERRLTVCSDRLKCIICRHSFATPHIRALLYSDAGLLQGDVCSNCLKRKTSEMQQALRDHSRQLLAQSRVNDPRSLVLERSAFELLDCAAEAIQLPTRFDWWLKHIQVFTQASQELESARFGLSNCACGKRSRLRIVFQDDD